MGGLPGFSGTRVSFPTRHLLDPVIIRDPAFNRSFTVNEIEK